MASPNGHIPNTPPLRRKRQRDENESPWSIPADSPLQQHFLELSSQIIEQTNKRYKTLDQQASKRESAYLNALDVAAAEHERIRREAEEAEEREWMIFETKQKAEKEEALRALQREREELEALNKKRQEEHERELARHRQAEEEARRLEEEKAATAARVAAEETERQQRQAQKAKEDEEAARKAETQREQSAATERQQNGQQSHQVNGIPTQGRPPSSPTGRLAANSNPAEAETEASHEADHKRYLALHKSLKQFRRDIVSQSKSDPNLKSRLGDMRREIRKSVGQLTAETQARKIPLSKIRAVLNEAQKYQNPMIDVTPFIISQPLPQVDASQRQVSGLLLYLLNIFSKTIIAQFIDETGADSRTADPIGIVAISIFAAPDFRWHGLSLIDMLVAKFHALCPVIFGIAGSERTDAGRARLGWRRDPDTGAWATEQRHAERMTGLGAGFGALTLRNFANAKTSNPYPPAHYWRAVAGIVNTPPPRITQTHCTVLRALVEHHVERFISFYGAAAIAVLRRAVVELPKEVQQTTAASSALAARASTIRRDLHLTL